MRYVGIHLIFCILLYNFTVFFFFLIIGKKLISTRFFALSIFNFSGMLVFIYLFIFQKKNSYTIINTKNFWINCKSQIVFVLYFSTNPIPLLLPITYKTFSKRWKRVIQSFVLKLPWKNVFCGFPLVILFRSITSFSHRRSKKFHWNSMCFTVAYSCQCILSWTF